jgi:hypothetical protein
MKQAAIDRSGVTGCWRAASSAAARCQPGVQRLEAGKPRQWREQPFADVADLVLDLALLPARRGGASDRLEQIVVGQHHEAAVEQPFLAGEDCLYNCLEIVIHHALRHAAEEGEGAVVRVEHHLLGFSGVGHDEHLAAECQPEMRDLDGLHNAVELDVLMAPVELTDLAGSKRQRNVGLRQGRAGFGCLPALHEPLHAVVGAAIPLGLQALEQPTRRPALRFRQQALSAQPGLQRLLERPQHWRRLLLPLIDRFALGPAMLANRRTRQFQATRNRTDALLADQMTAPDFRNYIHEQHPRFSGQTAG